MDLITILIGGSGIGCFGLLYKLMSKPGKKNPTTASRWEPLVVPSQKYTADYYASNSYSKNQEVIGSVSVRLQKGKKFMTLGSVNVNDSGFTEKINNLTTEAEEKASDLNMVEELYG